MIRLYFRPTANGHKITIFLEEAGLPYRLVHIHDLPDGNLSPELLRVSPNAKIPAIVDEAPADGGAPIRVFESAAILLYLADKTGRFLPPDTRGRSEVMQWLAWQVAGLGPISGQNGHFRHQALSEVGSYTVQRFGRELERLYTVLDHRLEGRSWVADAYSIADMAIHPWVATAHIQGLELKSFPNVQRWWSAMNIRPAVQRAYGGARYAVSPRPATDADHVRKYQQTGEMLRQAYGRMNPQGNST